MPPVIQTDTGSDTEVTNAITNISDSPQNLPSLEVTPAPDSPTPSRSTDDDLSDTSSTTYSTAVSDQFEPEPQKSSDADEKAVMTTGYNKLGFKPTPLARSMTFAALSGSKVHESFMKSQSQKPQPLLVIKRTPNKAEVPESKIGKPRVAVKSEIIADAKKYFGADKKKPLAPRLCNAVSRRSSESNILLKANRKVSFSFEPEDTDVSDYLEHLLENEDELLKPLPPQVPTESESEEESASSSIEDLMLALHVENKIHGSEEIDGLLDWIDDLDHSHEANSKYKHLETALKSPRTAEALINKIPNNSINFFENQFLGKNDEGRRESLYELKRSKTEDLDATSNVSVKNILEKFESKNDIVRSKSFHEKGLLKNKLLSRSKSLGAGSTSSNSSDNEDSDDDEDENNSDSKVQEIQLTAEKKLEETNGNRPDVKLNENKCDKTVKLENDIKQNCQVKNDEKEEANQNTNMSKIYCSGSIAENESRTETIPHRPPRVNRLRKSQNDNQTAPMKPENGTPQKTDEYYGCLNFEIKPVQGSSQNNFQITPPPQAPPRTKSLVKTNSIKSKSVSPIPRRSDFNSVSDQTNRSQIINKEIVKSYVLPVPEKVRSISCQDITDQSVAKDNKSKSDCCLQ